MRRSPSSTVRSPAAWENGPGGTSATGVSTRPRKTGARRRPSAVRSAKRTSHDSSGRTQRGRAGASGTGVGEGRVGDLRRREAVPEAARDGVRQPRPDVRQVRQAPLVVALAHQQRPDRPAARARPLGEPADHDLRLLARLHLAPLLHPAPGAVGRVHALGEHPLEAAPGRRGEQRPALALDVVAQHQVRRALRGDHVGQAGAPLAPGQVLDPLPVDVQQVEGHVGERSPPRRQRAEVRASRRRRAPPPRRPAPPPGT